MDIYLWFRMGLLKNNVTLIVQCVCLNFKQLGIKPMVSIAKVLFFLVLIKNKYSQSRNNWANIFIFWKYMCMYVIYHFMKTWMYVHALINKCIIRIGINVIGEIIFMKVRRKLLEYDMNYSWERNKIS